MGESVTRNEANFKTILHIKFVLVPKIGKLQGLKDDSGAGVFNGIPFSLPPVGKYRWRKPQPITERINTGEEYYNATYPRAACSEQHSFTNIIQPIKVCELKLNYN